MNQLEGLLILLGLPVALILSGYWLAARLAESEPVERLAVGLAAGLAVLLVAVAAVNFFHPLDGPWAFACLAPVLFTVALPRSRQTLGRDLLSLARGAPRGTIVVGAAFIVLLLWPVIVDPSTLFYDGSANHDSYFWIAGAEHLKRHTYMEAPLRSALHPITNPAAAIVGWRPPWGRMGAEGLLALASAIVGLSPLKLYLYGTACLGIVWCALVGLVLRTFVHERPARITGAAVLCLQPVFVFFYGNANLPNLLGALSGTALIIAVERALRAGRENAAAFTAWAALAALSLHGLLCTYPEMVPFVLLPCGLLWLRPWFTGSARPATRLLVAAALLAGLVLNPATAIRATHGFLASFATARADTAWANLFNPLQYSEYIPALASLSVPAAKELGNWVGWPLSLLLLVLGGAAAWRSRDRFGFLAGFAGGAVLLGYTIATDFSYGWQKTVQFCGVFVAAAFPAAIIDTCWRVRPATAGQRRLINLSLAVLVGFLAFATIQTSRDIYKWSDRKVISVDWYALRTESQTNLANRPVLVEAATFPMSFFHGMWAAYFMPASNLYFGARGEESGGYLRDYVVNEANTAIPAPAAILVGRAWADTLDANSPRLLTGREYVLLGKSNRVLLLEGGFPSNGPPDKMSARLTLRIIPHTDSDLVLELAPRSSGDGSVPGWRLHRSADGIPAFDAAVDGPPPWHFRIPLAAGRSNDVSIAASDAADPAAILYNVGRLRVEDRP